MFKINFKKVAEWAGDKTRILKMTDGFYETPKGLYEKGMGVCSDHGEIVSLDGKYCKKCLGRCVIFVSKY